MELNSQLLQQAAESLFGTLGALDDLGNELSNTVANVYYRFYAIGDMSQLGVKLKATEDMSSQYRSYMGLGSRALAEFSAIDGVIASLRKAKGENYIIGNYLVQLTLDIFKYRIPNAEKKSAIRRSIERRFRKVNEVAGLYQRMASLRIARR